MPLKLYSQHDTKDLTLEYIARLFNELTQVKDFISKQNKILIEHVETESLRRLEDLTVLRLLSRNILSFRIEKLIYDNPNHIISYIKTKDGQFIRLEISKDDYLNFGEKEFSSEKEFYCSMYEDLIDLAEKVPKELNKQILEEAEKVRKICE